MSTATAKEITNPFIGLRRFEIADSYLFYGRNEQSYELLRRLDLLHFLAVIGPSGCGKSSLVRAGVLAALQQGYCAEGGLWKIVVMQPGNDPIEEWTRQLIPHLKQGSDRACLLSRPAEALDTSTGKLVILVDQFEELFQFADRTGRTEDVETFLRALLATGAPDAKIYLILTMRSEYLVRCALYPALAEAINEGLYLVPRMTREQMRQAIVAPVKKGGGAIGAILTERLLDDAASDNDALPVLQHALMRMWPNRNSFAPMGLDLYPPAGLGSFLDQHAELIYSKLSTTEKRIAEALFRTITERTVEGRSVRRAQQLDAIVEQTGIPAQQLLPVIRRFETEGFLITIGDESPLVDISHEAVARQWKRLGSGIWEQREGGQEWIEGWMVAEARERRAVDRLREAATEWDKNDRHKSYLFRGAQLRRIELDMGARRGEGGELAQLFLTASRKADLQARLLTGRVLLGLGLALGIAAGILGFVWFQQRAARNAEADARDAEAVQRVAESLAIADRAKAVTAENQARAAQAELVHSDMARTIPATETKPRIYPQAWTAAQEQSLQPVLAKLRNKYLVPKIERVSIGPRRNELRYFRASEHDQAKTIGDDLAREGLSVTVTYVPGFEDSTKIRDNHFELWLAEPQAAALPQTQPQVLVLYLDESRRAEAEEIAKAVSTLSSDYAVTTTSYRAVTWNFTDSIELHYFHREDRAEAEKLAGKLQDAGAFYLKPRFMPVAQDIPSRYFEIWLQKR